MTLPRTGRSVFGVAVLVTLASAVPSSAAGEDDELPLEPIETDPYVLVEEAAATLRETQREAFASCVAADPLDLVCEAYPGSHEVWLRPVADMSGDGLDDVVVTERIQEPSYRVGVTGTWDGYRYRLEGRDGATGVVLWERAVDELRVVTVGRFGPAAESGVAFVHPLPGAATGVTALGSDGRVLWSVESPPGRPLTGEFADGGSTDLVFRDGATFQMVDGRTGAAGEPWEATDRSLAGIGDLDGDGREDLLLGVVAPATTVPTNLVLRPDPPKAPTRFEARSVRGEVIWSAETLVPFNATAATLVDLGSGHVDVYAYTGYYLADTADDAPPNAMLIDGASGSVLWSGPGGFDPVTCCGPQPRSIVTQRQVLWPDATGERISVAGFRYDRLDRSGRRAERREYLVEAPEGAEHWDRDGYRTGDLDGDAHRDFVHTVSFYGERGGLLADERAAVGTQDGTVLWRPTRDQIGFDLQPSRLVGPVDGTGDDFAGREETEDRSAAIVAVLSGRSGDDVWTATVPKHPGSYPTGVTSWDLTGDGHHELFVVIHGSWSDDFGYHDYTRVHVLDGRDGSLLWAHGPAAPPACC